MRLFVTFAFVVTVGCVGTDSTDEHVHTDHTMSDDMLDTDDIDEATEGMSADGVFHVSYVSDPSPIPLDEDFSITVTVMEGTDVVSDATVSVDATMPNHGHGMNTNPTTVSNGDGTYTTTGLLFHMEGWWELGVTVNGGDGADQAYLNVICCD